MSQLKSKGRGGHGLGAGPSSKTAGEEQNEPVLVSLTPEEMEGR